MGYQALLFCPDEKLARVVSQVFGELDFSVEPVHEPFAAVKKLMSQRYDAIVVDCENEQNASLLFKSARNSSSNQNSLAIALVEGQTGVAKAYRIGANLVLTKPINVEQAKGTLRVARGLLRKNSDAANAATLSSPARTAIAPASSASGYSQPAGRGADAIAPPPGRSEHPESRAPLAAVIPSTAPASFPANSASASAKAGDKPSPVPAPVAQNRIAFADEVKPAQADSSDPIKNDAAKSAAAAALPQAVSAFTSVTASAAATAPAKDTTTAAAPAEAPSKKEKENRIVESVPAKPSSADSHADSSYLGASQTAAPVSVPVSAGDAPSFAALGEEGSGGTGSKKMLTAAAVILALGALLYFGYGKLEKPNPVATTQPLNSSQNSAPPAPTAESISTPAAATSSQAPTPTIAIPLDKAPAGAGASSVSRIAANVGANVTANPASNSANSAANSEPGKSKSDFRPIVVKSNNAGAKLQEAEESAPQLPSSLAGASANDSTLSGLMSVSPSLPKASTARVRISQGVSEGLLIKRVQPKYPQVALSARSQGAVQIEATINKEGNVINLKVLKGDAVLAGAALDAVRQWRYKPYYLDGVPVEIQTQITVNFKAN